MMGNTFLQVVVNILGILALAAYLVGIVITFVKLIKVTPRLENKIMYLPIVVADFFLALIWPFVLIKMIAQAYALSNKS